MILTDIERLITMVPPKFYLPPDPEEMARVRQTGWHVWTARTPAAPFATYLSLLHPCVAEIPKVHGQATACTQA